MLERYTAVAPIYDLVSAEWPVYRAGRLHGIPLLQLAEGHTVLDIGCGTGLNFPHLLKAVGPRGRVVGVDASAHMLRAARRRARRAGARNVHLVCGDATAFGTLARQLPVPARGTDAVLFTYSLSLMRPWQAAWAAAIGLARPGARIVVVDMAIPAGRARVLAPLARLACHLGGADITAHPWSRLAEQCEDITHLGLRGGHIQIWAGTWRGAPEAGLARGSKR
jgi:ubiquinone/menaquinone biosynthesis C-methylase UbiE